MKTIIARQASATALFAAALLFAAGTASATLITNGDFEAGNTGFTSDYTYVTPGGGSLFPEAVYTVHSNPNFSHGSFYSMGDHTTGTGNMMIINGAGNTGISVWEGTSTFALTVGEEYDFSAWVASVHPASPASLTFYAGSTALGTLSPLSDGTWKRLFSTFTATEAFPTFSLVNANGASFGNDFAIDDIDLFLPGTTTNPTTPSVPDGGVGWMTPLVMMGLCFVRQFKMRK